MLPFRRSFAGRDEVPRVGVSEGEVVEVPLGQLDELPVLGEVGSSAEHTHPGHAIDEIGVPEGEYMGVGVPFLRSEG